MATTFRAAESVVSRVSRDDYADSNPHKSSLSLDHGLVERNKATIRLFPSRAALRIDLTDHAKLTWSQRRNVGVSIDAGVNEPHARIAGKEGRRCALQRKIRIFGIEERLQRHMHAIPQLLKGRATREQWRYGGERLARCRGKRANAASHGEGRSELWPAMGARRKNVTVAAKLCALAIEDYTRARLKITTEGRERQLRHAMRQCGAEENCAGR